MTWVTHCMTILFEFLRTSKQLRFRHENGKKPNKNRAPSAIFKGNVSRDFRPPDFFMIPTHLGL